MFLLSQILKRLVRQGQLTVYDADGKEHFYKGTEPGPAVKIRIHSRKAARKIAIYPKLFLGEAYMEGDLTMEEGGIYDLLDLFTRNLGWGSRNLLVDFGDFAYRFYWFFNQFNPKSRSLKNVAHHYDLSDEFCGWGGMARFLAENADVQVTGVTLSKNQLAYAQEKAQQTGLAAKVDYRLTDYRDVTEKFNRIVSVGMFEHVGVPHYREYFRKVKSILTEDGVALIHTIGTADRPSPTNAWIQKYIFPGGYIPPLSQVMPAIEKAGLYVTDVEILRLHYAETLRDWRLRFHEKIDMVREIYDDRFCRMWDYYLCASEVSFRNSGLVVFQVQLAKRLEDLPLTRDYITEIEENELSATRVAAE